MATALAAHRGSLVLDGLVYLPVEVAQAFSKHQGESLSLESLRFMSNSAAKALAGDRGNLEMPLTEVAAIGDSPLSRVKRPAT
jgi:hypothetical protein